MFKHPVFLLLLAASCSAVSDQGGTSSPGTTPPGLGAQQPSDPVSRIFTDGYVGPQAVADSTKPLSEKLDKSLWRVISGNGYYFLMFQNEGGNDFKFFRSPVISLRYTTSSSNFRRGTIISNTPSILIIERGVNILGYALLPGDKLASRVERFDTSAERQQHIDTLYSLFNTMISNPGGSTSEWTFQRITNASQYTPFSGNPNYNDYLYYYKP